MVEESKATVKILPSLEKTTLDKTGMGGGCTTEITEKVFLAEYTTPNSADALPDKVATSVCSPSLTVLAEVMDKAAVSSDEGLKVIEEGNKGTNDPSLDWVDRDTTKSALGAKFKDRLTEDNNDAATFNELVLKVTVAVLQQAVVTVVLVALTLSKLESTPEGPRDAQYTS